MGPKLESKKNSDPIAKHVTTYGMQGILSYLQGVEIRLTYFLE